MAIHEEKIARLTDQQALSIVDSLAGELADLETPEGKEYQAQALQVLLIREGHAIDISQVAESDTSTTATIAKQLLLMMAQVPEIRPSLDEWLDNPPTQEAAAIPLVLGAPVVLAGCIALLHVVGHVRFKRHPDGSWEVDYDPTKETPLDKTMKGIVSTLAGLMRSMIPGV